MPVGTAQPAKLFVLGSQVHKQASGVTLETALELYDLQSFELLWEKVHDTKVCMFAPCMAANLPAASVFRLLC